MNYWTHFRYKPLIWIVYQFKETVDITNLRTYYTLTHVNYFQNNFKAIYTWALKLNVFLRVIVSLYLNSKKPERVY